MFTYRLDADSYLKLLDIEDARHVFSLVDSNRDHLRRWLPWVDMTRSEADSRVFIEGTRKQFADGNGFQVGIWHCEELAGIAGFHEIDRPNRKTEIGYWLGESFQRRGLMTKTCRALIHHAFRSWKLNKVEICCGTGNARSCAIPERLGFTNEGTIREAEFVNGHYVSHHVYGILKSEWERKSMYGIEGARKDLLASVDRLTDEQLNAEVENGRWTVAQVLEHLYLIELAVTAQVEKTLADESGEPAGKKKPLERTLDRTYRVEAPTRLEPSKEFMSHEAVIGRLAESRERLLTVINGTDEPVLLERSAKHPVFGTMDLQQWIEFVGLHERRHLQQIEELKAKV